MVYVWRSLIAAHQLSRQVPAFLFVGALGFCIDAGLTVLLSNLGASPYLARPPAVIVATAVNFLLNRAFTFRRSAGGAWRDEFTRYLLVVGSGQVLNYAVYVGVLLAIASFGVSRSPTSVAFSVGCGAAAAMFLTFFGFRTFAFGTLEQGPRSD